MRDYLICPAQLSIDDFANLGELGPLVLLLLLLMVLAWGGSRVLLASIESGREKRRQEHEREVKRMETEERIEQARIEAEKASRDEALAVDRRTAAILERLEARLERSAEADEADRQIRKQQSELLHQHIELLMAAEQRMNIVTAQRERRLDDLQTDIQAVAGTVKAELQPQIDAIRANIEQGFKVLRESVEAQIDRLGAEIPESARRQLKLEIESYARQSASKLDQIVNVARTMQRWMEDHAELIAVVQEDDHE